MTKLLKLFFTEHKTVRNYLCTKVSTHFGLVIYRGSAELDQQKSNCLTKKKKGMFEIAKTFTMRIYKVDYIG